LLIPLLCIVSTAAHIICNIPLWHHMEGITKYGTNYIRLPRKNLLFNCKV